ncbi:hypothetical protein CIRG_00291 [Coccidioides immitis RMSCC 2394]|uniref:Uncharacterized protein n=1 Tax=Coccidioides immitis RMSCC 2394 TaxID=404692 RepID=A0A0J6XZE4_COCIT|nr:hypothetical protein CIRG_00291 [Coccidioides immitis RMSCC 2394]
MTGSARATPPPSGEMLSLSSTSLSAYGLQSEADGVLASRVSTTQKPRLVGDRGFSRENPSDDLSQQERDGNEEIEIEIEEEEKENRRIRGVKPQTREERSVRA